MRIAIIVIGNSRRTTYLNGHNLRYGGGGASGTDTSSILVGEYLAKQGHDVVICVDSLEPQLEENNRLMGRSFIPGEKSYGVSYTNIDFDGIENKNFDVLVTMLWFQEYDKLPIKVSKSIIYWCHMQWFYGVDVLKNYAEKNNLTIGVVGVSNWQKSMSQGTIDHLTRMYPNTKQYLIPNAIFDEMINKTLEKNIEKKKGKFIYHATWPTGGDVALDAVRGVEIEGKEFHAFDYFISVHQHEDEFFHNHQGVDRSTLFDHLAESEYFIYPLWTVHKVIRRDTFACTVAESLALGTIVLTYPLGALPEVFGDYVVMLDAPPGVDFDELQKADLARDEDGLFKYTQNIVDKINYLEKNPEVKERYREAGKKYIMDNYNLDKIGKMWDNALNELTND